MEKEILSESKASRLVMLGGSAGSLEAVLSVLKHMPAFERTAFCLVVHRNIAYESALTRLVQDSTNMVVIEIEDKMPLQGGAFYIAPPDYHLLCERDFTWGLDLSEKVNHSRPSIDVAFESAADAFGPALMCILLSGANADGAAGLAVAKHLGASVVVQDPAEAAVDAMPLAGLRKVRDATVCTTQNLPVVIADFAR